LDVSHDLLVSLFLSAKVALSTSQQPARPAGCCSFAIMAAQGVSAFILKVRPLQYPAAN
jgi:hypothetical protein